MSRTVMDGFVMGDVEKDFLLNIIKQLSRKGKSRLIKAIGTVLIL